MEGLNAADCQDVISKIGNLEDVYLIPFPKRQELVCFYIERCRFDYSATRRMYMASSDKSILYSYDTNSARTTKRGARSGKVVKVIIKKHPPGFEPTPFILARRLVLTDLYELKSQTRNIFHHAAQHNLLVFFIPNYHENVP